MRKRNLLSLLVVVLLILVMVVGLVACDPTPDPDPDPNPPVIDPDPNPDVPDLSALNGEYSIKVWVSEIDGVAELTQDQIDAFEALHPGITINAEVVGMTEADSATNMIADVEAGADIFCFAQDQLVRLVQAGCLTAPATQIADQLKAANDAGSINAATVGDVVYCYPLTSDNGYFMFYDKSVISEDILDSMEDIIAACEEAGTTFAFEVATSAWYTASFFFGTGAHSNWTTDAQGKFVSVDDTFNSAQGLVAMQGIQKLVNSTAYVSSSAATVFTDAVPASVLISGTWAAKDVQAALGDNYGATDLPSFTVDGQSYHLGSYSGNKLMGVKPQLDAKKAAVLQFLAQYLTNEECQTERFEATGWGPSNKAAQASDAVKNDPALSALAAQSAYSTPQGQIHGSWWDLGKALGASAVGTTTTDQLQDILDTYTDAMNALFTMSDAEKNAWTVIGGIGGSSWDTDFEMVESPAGTWTSVKVFDLEAGNEFKIRQGKSWDNAIGGGDGTISSNAPNYVVETAGTYKIQVKISGTVGEITLVPATVEAPKWGVVGSFAASGWADGKDVVMTEDPAGTWTATVALEAGNEFKVRFDGSWSKNVGKDSALNGDNIKVDVAGTYTIVLVDNGDGTYTLTYSLAE